MLNLAEEIDTVIAEAVKILHTYGYSLSLAKISSRLGITRQIAQRCGTSS